MPKYVDENGVRRVWQTAEDTFLKSADAQATYLKTADANSTYMKTSVAENTYLKSADAASRYLRADVAANTYVTSNDAEAAYLKQTDADTTYMKKNDAVDYLKKNEAESTYLKVADAGAISEENYTTAEKEKLAGLSNYTLPTASGQQLGGVKVGNGLDVTSEGIISVTPTDPNVDWSYVDNSPTTLAGYGITDAATKADIAAIQSTIEDFYVYRGSVQTVDDLANIVNPRNGDTYDVEDSGVNYAWNEHEGRWDSMGGLGNIMSMSEYELDLLLHIATTRQVLLMLLEEGGMTTLDTDITVSEPITLTKDTILDTSNHTLTLTANGFALIADGINLILRGGEINASASLAKAINGGTITVESGSYQAGNVGFEAIGTDSTVTFNSGILAAANGAFGAVEGGHVVINGGYITNSHGIAIYTRGANGVYTNTIDITSGNIVANETDEGYASCGVCLANKDWFTMTGGRITSTNGCGVLVRDGRAIIRGGIIAAEGTGSGWVGSNGTKMSHSAIIYHETALTTHYGMRIETHGGLFKGANLALEIISELQYPNIYINGGTFDPSI